MGNVVVVGSQWGDEGKGKIVDWLASRADAVVRFQGGHNAGHTLVVGQQTFKLSLLPSGIVQGKLSIIGNGVVIDPWALFEEIERLQGQGVQVTPERLMIAENAPLILPFHSAVDRAREAARGAGKIGTTGRGIGPAYEDKVARRAIRVCDLADWDVLADKLEIQLAHHNDLLRGLGAEEVDKQQVLDQLHAMAPKILPFKGVSWLKLDELRKAGKRVLFEGAQGAMLDIDHGTYPFVTSSNTHAAMASVGSGAAVDSLGFVLGITKAYTTRVGSGPFPTELNDEVGKFLGERGREFGTVTGRQRRCGWFDAVMVHQALRVGGVNGIALTKLDVLDGLKELKICVGYRLEGQYLRHVPASVSSQAKLIPVYETLQGWEETTVGARSWADLPANAIKYVRRIEELIETPVALMSTSPERDDTIMVTDPFLA